MWLAARLRAAKARGDASQVDVPASLLTIGSVSDVDEYAKKLITVVGKGGGLLYSTGCCAPMNAKHENMKAFFEAVGKYGRYN